MLVALAVTSLGIGPVRAASSVTIEARVLLGGRYEVGGWAAVAVTLVNESSPTEGYLTGSHRCRHRAALRRDARGRSQGRDPVRPARRPSSASSRCATRSPTGRRRDERRGAGSGGLGGRSRSSVTPHGSSAPQLARRSDPGTHPTRSRSRSPTCPSGRSRSAACRRSSGRPTPVHSPTGSAAAWSAGSPTAASSSCWEAPTGRHGRRASSDLLPIEELAAVDEVELAPLAAWAGSDEALDPDDDRHRDPAGGRPGPGDRCRRGTGRGLAGLGSGHVVFFGTDFARDAYRAWAGSPLLWSRVLDTGALSEFFGGVPAPIEKPRRARWRGTEHAAIARRPTGRAAARADRGRTSCSSARSATSCCAASIVRSWPG